MALIDGITSGLSLAVLGDGTIVHTERVGKRVWQAIHSDAGGAPLASIRSAVIISDVSAHPTDPAEALISIPARGVHMLDGQVFAAVEGVVALTPAQGAAALVTWGRAARWLAVDPGTHAVTDVAPAIVGADDAIAHPAGGALLILTGAAATRRLAILKPGQRPRTLAAVPGAFRLAPTGDGQVAIGYDDGRIEVRSPATLGQATLLTTLAAPIWGLALAPGGLLAGFGSSIDLVTVTEPPGVDLTLAAEQYLGSWARVEVAVRGGVVFDDLAFVVDPPLGGLVSASRDASFDPAHPNVIVAIGGTLGEYKLLALDSATGDVLGGTGFSVVDTWKHRDGPPIALVGPTVNDAPDAAWGGGDPYVPQNMNVRPRLGAYRVGVVVVETADQATLTNAAAATLAQTLRDEVFTGVARGGVTESTRLFFDAVSSGSLNLVDAGVVVPVRLPNNWDSYVAPNATTGRTAGDGLSNFSTAAVAELVQRNRDRVAAGQPPLIDLDTVDSLVFVLRSIPASGTNPGRHQWPYGSRPGGYQQSYIVGEDTFPFFGFEFAIPRVRTIQVLTMPTTWATEGGGRTLAETIGHELCHNFGLHDAYFDAAKHGAEFRAREMGSWDLMGNEGGSPELAPAERMQLGWVPAGHVRTLSVGVSGYVDEEVILHPAGRLMPLPAGRRQAIELRIADGRNYYFEYRRRNATALSDQTTPEDFVVVGTDYVSGDTPPTNRRPLTLLRDDSDFDGGTFGLGDDYEESDTSDPSYPNDFRMEVLETANEFARVRLRYADAKPDPSIRPWGQSTNWKSPDLVVENFRSQQNPALRDVPWEGHDNWVIATIRNTGRDTATNFEVTFGVKDFTLGGGAEHSLGVVTIASLAAGADVQVTSPNVWRPPALSGIPFFNIRPHYCVFARITPQADEITRDNNEAQSNHTLMISASSSPATRETGVVKVTNPHPVEARCRVIVRQNGPLSRTYLEHAWVMLPPGGERDVTFWTESMIGDRVVERYAERLKSHAWEMPNSLLLTGVADTGEGCHGDTVGGAHVTVVSGRRTRFVELRVGRGYAYGRVEVEESGEGVWGSVVVTLREEKDGKDAGVFTGNVVDGQFRFEFERRRDWDFDGARVAQGEFTGGYSAAPCLSDWVEVE